MIYYILCVCVCIYIYVCMYVCIYPSIQSCVCTSGFQKGRDKFPALSVCPALCLLLALPVARLLFLPPSLPPFLPPSLPPSLPLPLFSSCNPCAHVSGVSDTTRQSLSGRLQGSRRSRTALRRQMQTRLPSKDMSYEELGGYMHVICGGEFMPLTEGYRSKFQNFVEVARIKWPGFRVQCN